MSNPTDPATPRKGTNKKILKIFLYAVGGLVLLFVIIGIFAPKPNIPTAPTPKSNNLNYPIAWTFDNIKMDSVATATVGFLAILETKGAFKDFTGGVKDSLFKTTMQDKDGKDIDVVICLQQKPSATRLIVSNSVANDSNMSHDLSTIFGHGIEKIIR